MSNVTFSCPETRKGKTKCIIKKWLNKKEVADYKPLRHTNQVLVIGLGRFLDIVKYQLFNKLRVYM
jgi:hypothetical protein